MRTNETANNQAQNNKNAMAYALLVLSLLHLQSRVLPHQLSTKTFSFNILCPYRGWFC